MAKPFLTMELVGGKELAENLRQLPLSLQKGTVDRALKKAAKPMEDTTRGEARKAVRRQSSAPKIASSKKVSRHQKADAARTVKPGDRTIYVGARPSRVAHLLELGTRMRRTKKGANRGRVTPRPYMEKGFDMEWRTAADAIGTILGQEITKSAARLARRTAKAARK